MALKAIASTANEEKNESKREEDQYQTFLRIHYVTPSYEGKNIADFLTKLFWGFYVVFPC